MAEKLLAPLSAFVFLVGGLVAEVPELTLPEGFKAQVVYAGDGLKGRHIVARDNGDLYVSLRNADGNAPGAVLAMRDTDSDGKMDRVEGFGKEYGTSLEIHKGYLYHQANDQIVRWKLPEGQALVPEGESELVVSGFPDQNTHNAKAITWDVQDRLYVSVGAPSNACQQQSRTPHSQGMDPCPQLERHAGVWRFPADKIGLDQVEDGERFATGLRHCVAMDYSENAESVYVVMHGRDQLSSLWPEHYDAEDNAELPAEEFHRLVEGTDAGWPYTYWDSRQGRRMVAPEYGGDGKKVAHGDYQAPLLGFPAHWAPNDIHFYRGDQFPADYKNGAFVVFHGSWNRAPKQQQGYNVGFVPMLHGAPEGDFRVFAKGFAGRDEISSPSQAVARPCGVAEGPDGSLYIVEDNNGHVWRIAYEGDKAGQTGPDAPDLLEKE